MPMITEIAPDTYRISIYVPEIDLQFNHFLVTDDQPLLFEETARTLLCSDLFFHGGDVEPLTSSDLVERARAALLRSEEGPLAGSIPYTAQTERILHGLADLQPQTLAVAHGSSFVGDG